MVIDPHGVKVRVETRQRLLKLFEKDRRTAAIDRAGRHVPPKAQITHETGLLKRWRLKPRLRAALRSAAKPARAGSQRRLSNYPNNTLNAIMPRTWLTTHLAIERRSS